MLDRTIMLDGWSKTWAMTGWRLGFGVFPAELVPHVDRLISNSVELHGQLRADAPRSRRSTGRRIRSTRMLDEFTRAARRSSLA